MLLTPARLAMRLVLLPVAGSVGGKGAELPKGLSNCSCAHLALEAGLILAPRLVQGVAQRFVL